MVRGVREVRAHPSLMPWLPAEGRRRDAIGWLDTSAAQWLTARGVPLEVLESYTWPEHARVFNSATERLTAARARLKADGSRPALAAAAIVKAMSAVLMGGWLASTFGGERPEGDWLYRPDWWHAIRALAEVRKQRALVHALEAGALLVLGGDHQDSVYVAAESLAALEAAPGSGGLLVRPGVNGKFKVKAHREVTPELAEALAARGDDARRLAIQTALGTAEGNGTTDTGE